MTSILTNANSMAALQTLRSIDKNMATTQERISSGLKVGSAKDNAAYWSISTQMRAESSSLKVVGETLGMGASLADVSSTAIEALVDLTKQVRDRVVAMGEATNDGDKIATELAELLTQMGETVDAASFNGENWLTSTDATTNILSGVTDGTLNFIEVALQVSGDSVDDVVTDLNTAVASLDGTSDGTAIQTALTAVDAALSSLAEFGATFGASSSRIEIQKNFINSLTDAIDRGVGALVDADMTEESTRLQALQAQQQLAVQSLSIANSNSQLILQLFR